METRPELDTFQGMYLDAFQKLIHSRPTADGRICYINYLEISKYLDDIKMFDVQERMAWVNVLQAIDAVWVSLNQKKIDQEREKHNKKVRAKPAKRATRK